MGEPRARFHHVDPGLALVLAVAAVLRLPAIAQQSFWLDEAATLNVLHRSFSGMFSAIVHHESTPPLYYMLAWTWTHVFGYSEAGVRSLSAVAGIATVGVVFVCARTIAGRRAALVAGGLAAVNPLLIWYSQEARSYALLGFLGALSFYLAAVAINDADGRLRGLWRWAIVAGFALCTHYFAVFFIVPEAAWLLWRRGRAAWLPTGAVLAVGLALLPLALKQRSTGRTDWITGTALRTRLALIPKQFVTGLSAPHQTLLALLALAGVLAALAILVARRREVPEASLVAAGILVGAPIAMGFLAIVGIDLVLTRNAIGVLPLGLVAVGVGVDLLARHRAAMAGAIAAGVVAAVGLVAVVAVVTNRQYQRTDWRDAARVLTASHSSHLVVLDPPSAQLPLTPYIDLQGCQTTPLAHERSMSCGSCSRRREATGVAKLLCRSRTAFTVGHCMRGQG